MSIRHGRACPVHLIEIAFIIGLLPTPLPTTKLGLLRPRGARYGEFDIATARDYTTRAWMETILSASRMLARPPRDHAHQLKQAAWEI
jgi:hypothetical protein